MAIALRWSVTATVSAFLLIGVVTAARPEVSGLTLPHVDARGRFFTPWMDDPKTAWSVLKWWFTPSAYDKSGPVRTPLVANDGSYLMGVENSATVTWVGHATFAVHDGDDVFLTDPHFGKRALIPVRKVPPGIPIDSVPDDAFAVLSHNHYDHLDEWSVENLPESMTWFVPLGMTEWFEDHGRRAVELDWWQSATHGRWTITCLPSQHWTRRFGQGANEALWCAWLLDSGDYRYFFAGDTGYFHGFEEYGRGFGPIDVAMLPIGAYAPRWFMGWQHLDPAEAYQAFLDLGARFMLPMHWGTFDLTDEPVDLAPIELERVLDERDADRDTIKILAVGERWKIPDSNAGGATGVKGTARLRRR